MQAQVKSMTQFVSNLKSMWTLTHLPHRFAWNFHQWYTSWKLENPEN